MAWLEVAFGDDWVRYPLVRQWFHTFGNQYSVTFSDVDGGNLFVFSANSADGYPEAGGIT